MKFIYMIYITIMSLTLQAQNQMSLESTLGEYNKMRENIKSMLNIKSKTYNNLKQGYQQENIDSYEGMVVISNKMTVNTDTGYTGPKL